MVLSNAERQRLWREPQKEKNLEKFLQMERERKREAYKPVKYLTKKELSKRRKEVCKRVKLHYKRKKEQNMIEISLPEEGPSTSTRSESAKEKNTMFVKLPPPRKGQFISKKYKRSLRNAYRKIEELEEKNEGLKRNNKKIQKRLERLVKSKQTNEARSSEAEADISTNLETDSDILPNSPSLTPKAKTNRLLNKMKVNAQGRKILKKHLLFAECLTRDLKEAMRKVDKEIVKKMPFFLVRKYRFMTS